MQSYDKSIKLLRGVHYLVLAHANILNGLVQHASFGCIDGIESAIFEDALGRVV